VVLELPPLFMPPVYDASIVTLPGKVPVTVTEHVPAAERVQAEGEKETLPVPAVWDQLTTSPETEPE
jgi:hypothetical protein